MTYDPVTFESLPENDESSQGQDQGQGHEGEGHQVHNEQFVVENGPKAPLKSQSSQGWRDGQKEKRRSIEELQGGRRVFDRNSNLEGKRRVCGGSMTQSMTARIGAEGEEGPEENVSPLDENEEWAKVRRSHLYCKHNQLSVAFYFLQFRLLF